MIANLDEANKLFGEGKFKEALLIFDKALEEAKEDSHKVVINANRGAALMSLGEAELALKCFQDALAIEPSHLESLHNKAVVEMELENFEEALKSYESVLVVDKNFFPANAGKAECLAKLNRFEESEKASRECIEIDSNDHVGYSDLAFALFKQKKFQEANENYEVCMKKGDSTEETKRLYSTSLSSLALEVCESDPNQAIALLDKATSLFKSATNYHNRGILILQLGREDDAIRSFQSAIQENSNYFESRAALGCILVTKNKIPEAIVQLKKAIEIIGLAPASIEVRYNLGVCYTYQKNIPLAKEEFKKILQIDPNEQHAIDALRILEEFSSKPKKDENDEAKIANKILYGNEAGKKKEEEKSAAKPAPRRKSVLDGPAKNNEATNHRSFVRDVNSSNNGVKKVAGMEFGEKFYSELSKLEKEFALADSERTTAASASSSTSNKNAFEALSKVVTNYEDPKTNKKTYAELKNRNNIPGVAPHIKEEYLTSEGIFVSLYLGCWTIYVLIIYE